MSNNSTLPPAKSGNCPRCGIGIITTGSTQKDADRNYAAAIEQHKNSEYCVHSKKK